MGGRDNTGVVSIFILSFWNEIWILIYFFTSVEVEDSSAEVSAKERSDKLFAGKVMK